MVSLRIWLCVAILQGLALISTTTALGQDSFEAAATSESSQPILPSQPLPISIKRNASIAIIGAGPAGIHHALLLAQKGFSNIVVYEYSNEIGGKSKTIVDETGLPHEMGTCYAHTLYDPIFQLLNTYDPNNVLVPTDPTVPNNTWIMQGNQILFDYPTYLFQQAQTLTGITTLLGIRNATQAAFVKYISIHESIFGKYSYGLPPQPNNWTLLAGTALNFIQTNNLQAIQPWFQTMFERQGYGSLSTTPAFYMLWWGHPDLIRRYLALASQNKPFVYLLSKGFQSLWKSIAAANSAKFTVKLRSVVTGISNRDTKPQVTVRQYAPNANPQSGGATITIPHDHIVMAIDLSISSTDLSTDKGFPIIVSICHDQVYISSDSIRVCRLQLTRNTRLILTNSSTVSGRQTRVAYQHYEPDTAVAARSSYSSSLVQDLKSTFPSSTNLATFFSSYAPRTTKDKLTQNQPWAIWNYQG
ncbi:hypothetical protein Ae201684P_009476 [Aphanomyces euteiches]|nr:hypothetical protein Ae201684P_009476 [Aphanomyces euteiches]